MNLDKTISDKIDRLCEEGDALAAEEEFREALGKYRGAWELLPEPKDQWEASTWILTALGDAHFLNKEYQSALSALTRAVRCPDGLGNPFIHLRLGQCQLETRNTDAAKDELTRAYMGAGQEIFEEEDPKYFKLIESDLKPPPGKTSP